MFDNSHLLDEFNVVYKSQMIEDAFDKYGVHYVDEVLPNGDEYEEDSEEYIILYLHEYEILGSGANGIVLDLDQKTNDRYKAMKLTRNQYEIDYYYKLFEIAKTNPEVLNFVSIPEVFYTYNYDNDKIFFIFMDLLYQPDEWEHMMLTEIDIDAWNFNKEIDREGFKRMINEIKENPDEYPFVNEISEERFNEIVAWCIEAIKFLSEYGFRDAHSGNIMVDEDNNFKLIDLML